MPVKLGSTVLILGLGLTLAVAVPAMAGAAEPELKSEIDAAIAQLAARTHGFVTWDGADGMDFRQEGGTAVADITNARISIGAARPKPAERTQAVFDHIEIRRAPASDGAISLTVAFPREATLRTASGNETKLTLQDATGKAVLDAQSGRARESALSLSSARLDNKESGDWIAFGPLSLSSKQVATADGGWTAPIDFELKRVEFTVAEVPVGGAIDHIAYHASSAGPDLAAFNRLRDRIDTLRQQDDRPPDARLDALYDLLPALLSAFSQAKGELTVEGVAARPPSGEPYLALKSANLAGALSGLSGDTAAWRITLRHDGLTVAPAVFDPAKVPRRGVLDLGFEDVATTALRDIVDAARGMRAGASDSDKQRAQQQMITVAATLNPVFRVYEFNLDTADLGVEATAEAKGNPLSPKGFAVQADVAVRGFDALIRLGADQPLARYLPILQEIGAADTSGPAKLKFHVSATPQRLLDINGNDVTAWLAIAPANGLRPTAPPITGDPVRAVQHALSAAGLRVPESGTYDAATAGAVARFQKQSRLNINGVVDAQTAAKLGVKLAPAEPPAPKAGPALPAVPGEAPPRSH